MLLYAAHSHLALGTVRRHTEYVHRNLRVFTFLKLKSLQNENTKYGTKTPNDGNESIKRTERKKVTTAITKKIKRTGDNE